MKVGDLVKWHTSPIFLSKEEKYGLLIQIDYERSYSHQVLIGEKTMWFKPSDLEVIETL